MKIEAKTDSVVLRCSGGTRVGAPCRGHARYRCSCGGRWCGTHVVRAGAELRCPSCGLIPEVATSPGLG